MRIHLHHLYTRETETLEGTEEQLDTQLAERYPEQALEVDPDDEGLEALIEHINHEIQGVDIELEQVESLTKAQTPPDFPKLGIHGNRRETPYVTSMKEVQNRQKLSMNNAIHADPNYADIPASDRAANARYFHERQVEEKVKAGQNPAPRGMVSNTPGSNVSYAKAGELVHWSEGGHQAAVGVKNHEDFHQMMKQVEQRHGRDARKHLAANLLQAIPAQYRGVVQMYQKIATGNIYDNDPHRDEETLARMFNFANNSTDRGMISEACDFDIRRENKFKLGMKRALKSLRAASEAAHEKWLTRGFIKSELPNPTIPATVPPMPKKPRAKQDLGPNLVAIHNLTAGNVMHAHKLGGLAAPSLAITHKDHPLEGFGEISLVAHHKLIDPAHTPVYDADIYSPRHPRGKYRQNPQEAKKFNQWFEPYNRRMGRYKGDFDDKFERGGIEGVLDDRHLRNALGLAYFEEKGQPVELKMKPKRIYADFMGHPIMQEFRNDTSIQHNKHAQPEDEYYKQFSDKAKQALTAWAQESAKENDGGQAWADDLVDVYKDWWDPETGVLHYGKFDEMHNDMMAHGQMEPDDSGLHYAVDDKLKQEPPGAFEKWAKQKLTPVEGDMYLPKSTSRGWVKKPYNLHTVLKEMTKKIRQGEDFNYGLGTARAAGAKRFKTLEQVQKNRHRIVPKEQFKKLKDQMDERFSSLATNLSGYRQNRDDFGTFDSLSRAIGESYKKGHYLNMELAREGFQNVPLHVQQQIQQFAHDLLAMPTEYFEAKPQRAVQFQEFHGAAVPEGTDPEVLEILKRHGLQIEHYKKDDETARKLAIQKIAGDQQLLLSEDDLDAPPLKKKEDLGPSEYEAVEDQHGFRPHMHRAFAAARFLSGSKLNPDFALLRQNLMQEEGDTEAAALLTYGLPVTDQNIKALRAVSEFKTLAKAAAEQPSLVVVGHPDAQEVVEKINAAIKEGEIEPIKLGGVHSQGTLLVTGTGKQHWLLKPGANGPGPASGAQEQPASDSRREAAFYHVAKVFGIDDIPRADLVFMNGHEYAAIEMLPFDWKNLSKLQEKEHQKVAQAIERYRRTGQLHMWAALDWVLGNPDRHGQNLMISPEGEIKLIDHGSAFAGPDFDPARDKNSFIPYYLRAQIDTKTWKSMTTADRYRAMPTVAPKTNEDLKLWASRLDADWARQVMESYGVNAADALRRLERVKRIESTTFDEGLNGLWVTL
jgi:hypothetical protein